jgi:hypothetical protein
VSFGRALALLAPFCAGGGDVSAYDRRVEPLDEMGGSAHGCERVEERLEYPGLAQAIEPVSGAIEPVSSSTSKCFCGKWNSTPRDRAPFRAGNLDKSAPSRAISHAGALPPD